MTNKNSARVVHKDCRGRWIHVGDTVLYPVARSGSTMRMQECIVARCEVERSPNGPKPVLVVMNPELHVYKVRRLDRVVVVT